MQNSLFVLLASTFVLAFLHALAPDHWMPFAVIGKANKWSKSKLLWITFISGIGHVGISVVFSVVGLLLGVSLSKLKSLGGGHGEIGLWLLIGFGIAYTIWGIKKARDKKRSQPYGEQLDAKTVAMWTTFAIVILGPCEILIPLIFLSYNYGYAGVMLVGIVFSAVTITMMLVQSFLAFVGMQWIKNDIIERYSHVFAGLVIVLTGIFVMLVGI